MTKVKTNGTPKATAKKAPKKNTLEKLFECLKVETVIKEDEEKCEFPFDTFNHLMDTILFDPIDDKQLKIIRKHLFYTDLRYFTLKYLENDLNSDEIDDVCLDNLLNIMSIMPGLIKAEKKEDKKTEATPNNENANEEIDEEGEDEGKSNEIKLYSLKREYLTDNTKLLQQDVHRKLYNDLLVKLLKQKLNPSLFKKFLLKLPEKILPKMSNPLMLADFLTQTYSIGGLLSVLALNSLFILMTKYNLEYPKFFEKVYQLLDPSLFHSKYKDRFFRLLDLFLTSTHLSVYITAAFIKKLSRLALFCPPADLCFLIAFIRNLIIRHPSCKSLIHKARAKSLIDDPFDVNCCDFNRCHAMSSSLWEIQSLKSHYLPQVVKEANLIDNLGTTECELDDLFENNTYAQLLENEFESNAKMLCPVNFIYDNQAYTNSISILKFE